MSVSKTWCFTLNNWTPQEEKFFDDIDVAYSVIGKEGKGPVETPHLQGAITFRRAYRLAQLKKLSPRAHWEVAKAIDAHNYCMKDGDYKVVDNRTGQGQRSDFQTAAARIATHRTKRALTRDPELYSMNARYGRWVNDMFDARPAKKAREEDIVFRPWQKKLLELVKGEANGRVVHWFHDPVGGQGKSFMTNILLRNYDAFLAAGKKADALYAYSEMLSGIIIFDLTRSQEGEFCPYSLMETLLDGNYLNTKYRSGMVMRDDPAHLIVFANFEPDRSKMSADRWRVHHLH